MRQSDKCAVLAIQVHFVLLQHRHKSTHAQVTSGDGSLNK